MKTAREVAEEMVPAPKMTHLARRWVWFSPIADDQDSAPLEPQAGPYDATNVAACARGIIERLVNRSRAEGAEAKAAECDAWKRLAMARWERMHGVLDVGAVASVNAVEALRDLGIDAYTGEPIR